MGRWLAPILVAALAACGRVGYDAVADGGGGDDALTEDAPDGLQPIHQYHLDGDYQDDYGGPALTPAGGTSTAGGYQFGPNQGLSVSGAMLDRVYTVDPVFAFDTLSGWHKILDFEDLVTDEGYYTYGDLAQFVVVAGSSFADGPPGLIAGTTYQMTLSRDAAATVTAYVDGAQVFQFVDAAEVATLVAPAARPTSSSTTTPPARARPRPARSGASASSTSRPRPPDLPP
ncbi:MAG: hypothetical protein IPL61_08150 [Myxococcales bacterium]|nr:hypothetical protein [Myxococcales bacterium]